MFISIILIMATSKQESLFNEIVEYYNFADKLITIIDNNKDKIDTDQMQIVEEVVENLEKNADQLSRQFVEIVKNGSTRHVVEDIRQALNGIISGIEECRNKILMIYNVEDLTKL